MAADPFRVRVLNALRDTLKEITPANGYQCDFSDTVDAAGDPAPRVYVGRALFGDNDPLPLVAILESVEDDDAGLLEPNDGSEGVYDWPVLIQVFGDDDSDNPTTPAYKMLADIRQRLQAERGRKHPQRMRVSDIFGMGTESMNKSGNSVDKLSFSRGKVRPADTLSAHAYGWLKLTISIVENASNPYG